MATKEVDLLGEAIAGTEAEIFGEAVNGKEVETGDEGEADRSLEAMDEVEETDAADEGDEGEADGEDEGEGADAKAKSGTDPNRDEKGKFAKDDASDKGDKSAGDDKGDQVERKGNPAVPLREERQKRQTLETELEKERRERATERESFQTKFAQLEGRLDQVLRTQPQPAPKVEDTAKNQPPDQFTDPEGYNSWVEDKVAQRVSSAVNELTDRFINTSMADAHEKHGKTFETAYQAVTSLDKTSPANRALVASIRNAPNPGARLMQWHREQETLREVGSDPTAYKQKIADEVKATLAKDPEFRKQLMDQLKEEARGGNGNGNQPRTIIRKTPPSLNGASGRGESQLDPRTYDNSEGAVFDSAFEA